MNSNDRPRIGFIGLGNMGLPMASHLVKRGWQVHVHDHHPERVEEIVALGGKATSTLDELAQSCRIICIMVWDDEQLRQLCVGPDNLLSYCGPDHLLVIHSSVTPSAVRSISQVAAERGTGIIDAPVSGGAAGNAGNGLLTMIVGGSDSDVARCRLVFDDLARRVFHVGGLGSGCAAKIANNTMASGNLLLLMEALRFGKAYGIQPSRLLEVVAVSSGRSYSVENLPAIIELLQSKRRPGTPRPYESFHKDLQLTVSAAEQQGLQLLLTEFITDRASDVLCGAEPVANEVLESTPDNLL